MSSEEVSVTTVDDLATALEDLQIEYEVEEEPLLVKNNPELLSELLGALDNELFETYSRLDATDFADTVFQLIELEEYTSEFDKIKTSFNDSMRRCFTVDRIERVENPYLLIQYALKKMKKNCSELTLFHGTGQETVESICKENFNWRLCGTSLGHRFGRGISFSPESTYSSHYGSHPRVMFVTKVLVKSTCFGDKSMTIPDGSADTSVKPDGKVVVKYEDNDFYPEYIIYYS